MATPGLSPVKRSGPKQIREYGDPLERSAQAFLKLRWERGEDDTITINDVIAAGGDAATVRARWQEVADEGNRLYAAARAA